MASAGFSLREPRDRGTLFAMAARIAGDRNPCGKTVFSLYFHARQGYPRDSNLI
jgi:hypothetical protein